jgi:putative ATP-binding cassette transporter
MDLFKFLWSTSKIKALHITVLSVINGVAGGLLVILLPDAAVDIYVQNNHLLYLTLLPVIILIFLTSKHFVLLKTEALAGAAVEEMIMQTANTVRHLELPEFQQCNREDIILGVADAQIISKAACKNMETLQVYITLFIGWFYITFFLSPLLGLFLITARFLQILIQEMFGKILFSCVLEQQKDEKEVFTTLQNHLYGFKELKFNQKKSNDIFRNYLLPQIEADKKKRIIARRYGAELVLSGILVHFLGMVCCIFFSASLGAEHLALVMIILIFSMQQDMLIKTSIQNIQEGSVALGKLRNLFPGRTSKRADEDIPVPSRETDKSFQNIRIDNVGFTYPAPDNGQGFSINIEDLTINSGEILFIVGGNGSGKSTFMNVLTGLYPPGHGAIQLDGHPVATDRYRDMFSAVFADFHLFDRLYGIDSVEEEQVQELLRMTGLEGKTEYQQGRFTTQNLSTGQRKRLALVVALLEDRPVFVFDEWAADQDPHFRCFFYQEILPSLKEKGKTIIAVTHDDRYFHHADKVVRMEYGKITEQWRPGQEKSAPLFSSATATGDFSQLRKGEKEAKKDIARPAPESGRQAEQQETEEEQGGMLAQLRKIFREERAALRKTVILLFLFAFSLVALAVQLLHVSMVAELSAVQYIRIILLLLLLVVSYRNLQKSYYQVVEGRNAALRLDVIDHIRHTSLLTLKQIGVGRIYTVLTSDIRTIASTSNIIIFCLQGGIRIGMIYLSIALLYPPAFLIMLIFTGIGAAFYYSNHLKLVELFEKTGVQEKKVFETVTHLLDGFKELKLSSRRSNDFYRNSFVQDIQRLKALRLDSRRYYSSNAAITYGFWKGIMLIILFVLPGIGIGVPQNTLPVVIALILTIPLQQVVDLYAQIHMALLSIRNLFRFEHTMKSLDREPEEHIDPDLLDNYASIRYEDISFTYQTQDERPFSIGPLNIGFSAGEIVFITGGNGSGKSTLLNVVTGLYLADSGKIFLNNGQETDIRLHRELFGTVFTDFHLFDRLYGMEEVDEEKLKRLLRQFDLEKKVQWTDGKFSTLDLSTGQKKRLALVITILEDKPIYVLDEWAADQDPHFREYFYTTLLPEFKEQEKTILAVTHDDMYFHTADRILHLEYGQLSQLQGE